MLKKAIVVSILTLATNAAFAQVAYMPGTAGNNNNVNQTSNQASGGQGGAGGKAEQGQLQGQGQLQTSNSGGNSLANSASGNSTGVAVGGDTYEASRFPASTAYAAPLTSGADTCMGSSSAGAQGMSFGVSFGSTWTDSNCMRLKNAKMMDGLGYRDVAVTMMCADPTVAEAMKATNHPCPTTKPE